MREDSIFPANGMIHLRRARAHIEEHLGGARERVARAQHLLISTGEPLTQIALVCGFSDQSHFSRSFRRTVGASPGQWRRMNPAPLGGGDHV